MVFHENTPIDRIYYGSNEVMKVVYNGEEVWTPTVYPSEEAQFEPDEHHPVDDMYEQYGFGSIYMRIPTQTEYHTIQFPAGGTTQYDDPRFSLPMPAVFWNDTWVLTDPELTQHRIDVVNIPYHRFSSKFVQIATLVPEDISEGVRLYYIEPLAYSIQGVGDQAWSVSRKQGEDASVGNEIITELYIGDWGEIIEIGRNAFMASRNLKNIRLPSIYFSSIGSHAFADCSSLGIADLRNCASLNNIHDNAFRNCTSLEKVILPRLNQIHCTAFSGCMNLEKIILLAETPPEIVLDQDGLAYGFEDVSKDLVVKVKPDAIRAYRSSERWNVYDIQPYTEEDFIWTYEP